MFWAEGEEREIVSEKMGRREWRVRWNREGRVREEEEEEVVDILGSEKGFDGE